MPLSSELESTFKFRSTGFQVLIGLFKIGMTANCCHCIDRRTGVKTIALLYIVAILASNSIYFVQAANHEKGFKFNAASVASTVVPSVISIGIQILLLIGVSRNTKWMVFTWLIVTLLCLVLGFCYLIYLFEMIVKSKPDASYGVLAGKD